MYNMRFFRHFCVIYTLGIKFSLLIGMFEFGKMFKSADSSQRDISGIPIGLPTTVFHSF